MEVAGTELGRADGQVRHAGRHGPQPRRTRLGGGLPDEQPALWSPGEQPPARPRLRDGPAECLAEERFGELHRIRGQPDPRDAGGLGRVGREPLRQRRVEVPEQFLVVLDQLQQRADSSLLRMQERLPALRHVAAVERRDPERGHARECGVERGNLEGDVVRTRAVAVKETPHEPSSQRARADDLQAHVAAVGQLARSELASVPAVRPATAKAGRQHRKAVGPAFGADGQMIEADPSGSGHHASYQDTARGQDGRQARLPRC
jgi:hypothetical protein